MWVCERETDRQRERERLEWVGRGNRGTPNSYLKRELFQVGPRTVFNQPYYIKKERKKMLRLTPLTESRKSSFRKPKSAVS